MFQDKLRAQLQHDGIETLTLSGEIVRDCPGGSPGIVLGREGCPGIVPEGMSGKLS